MAGKDKEQNSRTYRDQLITIGDLEIFKQNLIDEIRNLLTQAPSSQSKKWRKSLERYETSFRHTLEFMKWKYKASDIDIKELKYEFISGYESS